MAVQKINRNTGSGGGGSWANAPTILTIANNLTTTSNALTDVTGWEFNVTANKTYKIQIIASHQTLATTTGLKLAVYLSSGVGTIVGYMEGGLSALAVNTEIKIPITAIGTSNIAGSFLLTTGVSAINTKHYIGGNLVFKCITSGVFKFQYASEINLSGAQLNQNSVIIVEEI